MKSFIRYSEKKSIVEPNLFSRFEYILKIFRLEIEHDDLGYVFMKTNKNRIVARRRSKVKYKALNFESFY